MTKQSLEHYLQAFARLNRAPGKAFPESTRHRAPHKPLLLLGILDMVQRRAISSPFISIAGEMTELATLFTAYWRRVMPIQQASSIAFPFSRLGNERIPFWRLEPLPGKQVQEVATVSSLRNVAMGAHIDPVLFGYMKDPKARSALTEVLLTSHFSVEGQAALRDELGIQQNAFSYSVSLEKAALRAKDPVDRNTYSEAVRDQGFRRAIVNCYDHRCAMCGTRIVTADGYTAVEAAHIKPWCRFKNDDITNGMALCRLCHWAFDGGMMAAKDDFTVVVSRQLTSAPNAPGYLMTLAGRKIIGPSETALWPDPVNLAWHRKEVFSGV